MRGAVGTRRLMASVARSRVSGEVMHGCGMGRGRSTHGTTDDGGGFGSMRAWSHATMVWCIKSDYFSVSIVTDLVAVRVLEGCYWKGYRMHVCVCMCQKSPAVTLHT
jgi:hypothetical protein